MKKLFIVVLVSCYSLVLFSGEDILEKFNQITFLEKMQFDLGYNHRLSVAKYNERLTNKDLFWSKYLTCCNLCRALKFINREIDIAVLCALDIKAYCRLQCELLQSKNDILRDVLWGQMNAALDTMSGRVDCELKKEIRQSSAIHVSCMNSVK